MESISFISPLELVDGGVRHHESDEGYLVDEAAVIQAQVCLPVIGVGGIKAGKYIDDGILAGRFALAAVGRAVLENPKNWFELNLQQIS